MKLAELAARIAEKSGISNSQAEHTINALKEIIAEELKTNEKFYLYGLGTLQVQLRKARRGRNPRTGEVLEIPPKRVIKWSSSKMLERKVGAGEVAPMRPRPAKLEGVEQPTAAPAPSEEERAHGYVISTAEPATGAEPSPIDMVPDFLAHDAGSTLEEAPPISPTPAAITPSAGAVDEERLLRRARSMAKVNVEDIFLYYGDSLKEALAKGQDPKDVVAEQLEQARKTLARRVGTDIASREDFVGNAFQSKMESFSAS